MQMLEQRDEWSAVKPGPGGGRGHQMVFQWSDPARSLTYRAGVRSLTWERKSELRERERERAELIILTCSGGGGGADTEALEGVQDGHGSLHVYRKVNLE